MQLIYDYNAERLIKISTGTHFNNNTLTPQQLNTKYRKHSFREQYYHANEMKTTLIARNASFSSPAKPQRHAGFLNIE